jgi:hypothetical protein
VRVNPMITIMAFARRVAGALAQDLVSRPSSCV